MERPGRRRAGMPCEGQRRAEARAPEDGEVEAADGLGEVAEGVRARVAVEGGVGQGARAAGVEDDDERAPLHGSGPRRPQLEGRQQRREHRLVDLREVRGRGVAVEHHLGALAEDVGRAHLHAAPGDGLRARQLDGACAAAALRRARRARRRGRARGRARRAGRAPGAGRRSCRAAARTAGSARPRGWRCATGRRPRADRRAGRRSSCPGPGSAGRPGAGPRPARRAGPREPRRPARACARPRTRPRGRPPPRAARPGPGTRRGASPDSGRGQPRRACARGWASK